MKCPSRLIVFILSLSFCAEAKLVEDDSSGFADFSRTNVNEFNNKPITFSYPVPRWLKGTLIRNGRARYEMGQRSFTNAFDGFGKLHSFTFYSNGTVSMSARFLQTEYYKQSLATNTIAPYFQFGKLVPPYNEMEKIESLKNQMENLNVNVYRIRDSKTGVSIVPYIKSIITLYRMTSVGDREEIVPWDIEAQTYMHSFSVTKNYVIFIGQPVSIDIMKVAEYDLITTSVSAESFKPSKNNSFANNLDMPTINENFRHVKYCYAYGLVLKADNKNFNKWALVKKDVCRVDGDLSWVIDNHYPSEAWFEPTPNSSREDDGVLMTHVFDGIKKESYLVLINATTMETMNKAILPTTMPFSFHGRFFQDN
ncbi:retinoid isomerohydrolase-like [Mytilus californianus]|uniref:retinoid isomerohydrolase-like n=1 Tax=Mytilus californianus TaxID=6549 RepID=UPI002247B67C|nr:retinoid isomerohydrolase-like [Mytilus californianus]